MGLREWIDRLRRREDDSATRRVKDMETETAEERAALSGDVEGMGADQAARMRGDEISIDEPGEPRFP